LLGLLWMLPNTFIVAHGLHVMSSLVMLILVAAVAHEAYQMAMSQLRVARLSCE
jgi:hypothetical protein